MNTPAIENPPIKGERVKISNQANEIHNVRDLALLVSEMTGAEIRYFQNPRKEDPENSLKICNDKFLKIGLNSVSPNDDIMDEVFNIVLKYKYRCDSSKIICTSTWIEDIPIDREGSLSLGEHSKIN